MNLNSLTTKSLSFTYSWARFMSTGYFGMEKNRDKVNG